MKYNAGLDLFKLLAFSGILISHSTLLYLPKIPASFEYIAYLSTEIFFLISGFFLSDKILSSPNLKINHFFLFSKVK